MAEVVVGVDGSPQSFEALRLAAREARCRDGRLRAVYVYEPVRTREAATVATVTAGMWPGGGSGAVEVLRDAYRHDAERYEQARQHAEDRLAQLLREVGDALDGLTVERTVIGDEHPSVALIQMAGDADLLVVGSRGLGGFKGLLLGSVSQQCVQHATCPVLVVRPRAAA